MRGSRRWAENRRTVRNAAAQSRTLRIAARPPHPRSLRSLDLSPRAGRGEKANPFSRRVFVCARVLPKLFTNGLPNEGRRSAERRIQPLSAPHVQTLPLERARARKRALRKPARLPALHRGSRPATECFDSAQAALHANGRARALPAPPLALKRSTPRAGRNAGGDDARAARVRGYEPRPREPLPLRFRDRLEKRPNDSTSRMGF